jgi:hypothetical protein
MEDYVLMTRLDALRECLRIVAANLDSKAWAPEEAEDARVELLGDSSLWTGLQTLVTEINRHIGLLDQIDEKLWKAPPDQPAALSAAWVHYGKSLRDSEGLLRECLEIIGSLAIRNQDLDDKLLYVADELIRDCMTVSISDGNYYLLVNSVIFSDAFSRTRARIIRLRFPAWTIWNLPFAAHEVGHVANWYVLNQERDQDEPLRVLTPFKDNQRASLVANDADLNELHQAGGGEARQAEDWADARLRVLLADAFATYTMGPAYACSAIMLRLNPLAKALRDMPADLQRAHVILSTLGCMNGDEDSPTRPYNTVIGRLKDGWEKALERSTPASALTDAEKAYLEQLAEAFTRDIGPQIFTTAARYPDGSPKDGWTKAQEWANSWWDQRKNGKPFSLPDNPTGKLRDALNAAWLCRLSITGDFDVRSRGHNDLANTATRLCQAIIGSRAARKISSPDRIV